MITEHVVNRLLAEHLGIAVVDRGGVLYGVWGESADEREWNPSHDALALDAVLTFILEMDRSRIGRKTAESWNGDEQPDIAFKCLQVIANKK